MATADGANRDKKTEQISVVQEVEEIKKKADVFDTHGNELIQEHMKSAQEKSEPAKAAPFAGTLSTVMDEQQKQEEEKQSMSQQQQETVEEIQEEQAEKDGVTLALNEQQALDKVARIVDDLRNNLAAYPELTAADVMPGDKATFMLEMINLNIDEQTREALQNYGFEELTRSMVVSSTSIGAAEDAGVEMGVMGPIIWQMCQRELATMISGEQDADPIAMASTLGPIIAVLRLGGDSDAPAMV